MAIISGKALKAREMPEFTVDLGDGQDVLVRRPDLQLMILKGMSGTPLLAGVVAMFGEWMGKPIKDLSEDALAKNDEMIGFLDTVVCAAVVDDKEQVGVLVGGGFKRSQYLLAKGEIDFRITGLLHLMDAERAKKAQEDVALRQKIIQGKGGMMDFARKFKRGG